VKGNKNGSFYTKLPERYIRNSSSQITVDDDFLEAAKAQTNQRIRVLKNILEQYHTNTVEPYFKSNLISKYHMNFSSTLSRAQGRQQVRQLSAGSRQGQTEMHPEHRLILELLRPEGNSD
jgi:hypothetical protein